MLICVTQVSFWIVFAIISIIIVSMGMTTLASKHEGINATFLSILSQCPLAIFIPVHAPANSQV